METTYKILEGIDAPHMEPTVDGAEKYARFIVRCAVRQMTERLEIARQFGWDAKEVKDEVFYAQYQKERAKILFPSLEKEIDKKANSLVVPEVDRAEVNFTKLTGLALNEPSLTLTELGSFLTQLTSTASKVDMNLTNSREQQEEQEQAS